MYRIKAHILTYTWPKLHQIHSTLYRHKYPRICLVYKLELKTLKKIKSISQIKCHSICDKRIVRINLVGHPYSLVPTGSNLSGHFRNLLEKWPVASGYFVVWHSARHYFFSLVRFCSQGHRDAEGHSEYKGIRRYGYPSPWQDQELLNCPPPLPSLSFPSLT